MKNKLLLIFTACFLIASSFVLGAFSSSFTNGVGVPWLKVLANKLPKEVARDLNVDFSYPRIDMGGRVRDFEITNSGMLFIAYDESNLIYLKPKKMP